MNNIIRLVGLLVIVALSSIAYLIGRPLAHTVLYSGMVRDQGIAFDVVAIFGTTFLGFMTAAVIGVLVTALYFFIMEVLLEVGKNSINAVRKTLRR